MPTPAKNALAHSQNPPVVVVCLSSDQRPMPTTIGYSTLLLNINMLLLPGSGLPVSDRSVPADRRSGGLVEINQSRHPVSSQNPFDRGTLEVQVVANPMRPPLANKPQRHDPLLKASGQTPGRAMRPRREVRHGQAGTIPGSPFHRRCRRALEPFRGPPRRPTLVDDESGKTKSPLRSEWRINVSREDLR